MADAKDQVATISSPLIRKNTWNINMPTQISTKPNHRSRCTKIQQHLEHQKTLYAQFARQVFLQKKNQTNDLGEIR